jgi:hypothetical protein
VSKNNKKNDKSASASPQKDDAVAPGDAPIVRAVAVHQVDVGEWVGLLYTLQGDKVLSVKELSKPELKAIALNSAQRELVAGCLQGAS